MEPVKNGGRPSGILVDEDAVPVVNGTLVLNFTDKISKYYFDT